MGRGAAEITIKGLCGGPTAELLGVLGSPRGALEVCLLLTLLL